ncbi:MAG: Bro-N domain-containing protein [Clostridia bacterium]
MNNKLEIVKSENFNGIECDFYSDKKDVFMTINQLANCLKYKNGRKGIENLISRNEYLKNREFSVTLDMRATDGKQYNTRVFTEDGIYEVTMLARTEKAREFRDFVRKVLKSLRKGESKLIKTPELQRLQIEAKLNNSRARVANVLLKLADKTNIPEYKQVILSNVSAILSRNQLIPLPSAEKKTYSANEIGDILGITGNMVGRLANANNLKTDKYGKLFYDKSKYSSKQVETFRYYENIIPELRKIL